MAVFDIIAVRGATTLDSDCREEVERRTVELVKELFARNKIDGAAKKCVSIIISATQDIKSFYPARAVRESGLTDAPLFSCAEPDIIGALPLCVRIMLTMACAESGERSRHIYLRGAAGLRPDLAE